MDSTVNSSLSSSSSSWGLLSAGPAGGRRQSYDANQRVRFSLNVLHGNAISTTMNG